MSDRTNPKTGTLPFVAGSEVVKHLSVGLYRNFARAAKELVSNSYDADATEVKIKLDLEDAKIVVRDNGKGMNIDEIRDRLLHIASRTLPTDRKSELGRRRIGTFGIGWLSVFPYCDNLQIITKRKGQDEVIELVVDTGRFFDESGVFRSIEEAKASYTIETSDLPTSVGETIVILNNIKPHIIQELRQKELLGTSSIDKFTGFERFKWTLCQYAPIQFSPDRQDLSNFFHGSSKDLVVPLRLFLDGEELFRNVPEDAVVLEKEGHQFGEISLKYAIMTTMKPILPEEARGLQIRLRDVAIGIPRDFDVTKFTGKVLGKMNYVCGEIQILSGLDSSLMVSRDNFYYTQDVANLENFFRKLLIKWNDTLEEWASEDRQIYRSLAGISGAERIIDALRDAGVIRFSKERLRLPRMPTLRRKGKGLLSQVQKLNEALSGVRGYTVVIKKGRIPTDEPWVEIAPEAKTITIHADHPDLEEFVKVEGKRLRVSYDHWDTKRTPYSLCRLSDDQNVVTFNVAHPLFKSELSDEVIKQLALGILLISKGRKDSDTLVTQLNRLLEQAILG